MRWRGFLLTSVMFMAGACAAVDMRLAVEEDLWQKVVFLDEPDKTVAEPAVFAIVDDPEHGKALRVGPWRAGMWGVRYQYARRLPYAVATIRGWYKTQDLFPFQAQVVVSYFAGEERLAKRRYDLAPSPVWRAFEVTARYPPTGADGMSLAFGLGEKTAGSVVFADLSISDEAPEAGLAMPGRVKRMLPLRSYEPSDTWRIERGGQEFWLVSPKGKPFYSLGAVGPVLEGGKEAADGPAWAEFLRQWGFNSLAGWTSLERWAKANAAIEAAGKEPLPVLAVISTSNLPGSFVFLNDSRGRQQAKEHAFGDPWDPAYEAAYRAAVRKAYDVAGDSQWLVGWFADNELSHDELYRYVYSTFCGQQFAAFLQKRHGTIGRLNTAWGTSFASFDDLLARRPEPRDITSRMGLDFLAFEREIVARHVEVTISSIRSFDEKRPIFSNRFMASGIGAYVRLLDLYSRYDAIGVNLYPTNRSGGLSENETAYVRMFHQFTGKPVIIGEWSVPAMDSGLYDLPRGVEPDWSFNEAVGTQAQRATQAAAVTLDFYNLPFVLGSHWFTWRDFDSPARRANRGLMRSDGQPWTELLNELRRVHRLIVP